MFFSPHIHGPRPEVRIFLEDVREHPDEDTPRLILADWLDDHGDEIDRARAEHIRVQCSLARGGPAQRALARRETWLEQEYHADWLGPLEGLVDHWRFERGLVHLGIRAMQCYSPELHDLVRTETWAWVDGLTLQDLSPGAVPLIVRQPFLPGVSSLTFAQSRLGDNGLAVLAGTRRLPALRSLSLAMCSIGPANAGITALADSGNLAGLERLDLTRNHLVPTSVARLGLAANLPRLRHLALGFNDLPDEAAVALADAPLLGRLEALDLRGNRTIGGAGLAGLLRSEAAAGLRLLNLTQTTLRRDTVRALAGSPSLAGLTHLYLDHTGLPNEALKELAFSPHLGRLHTLSLGRNNLTDEGIVALTLSPSSGGYRRLELGRNHIGREGAAALAGWPLLIQLEELGLEDNHIGDEGALALALSPFLCNLRLLEVGNNDLTAAGKAALLRRFGRNVVLV